MSPTLLRYSREEIEKAIEVVKRELPGQIEHTRYTIGDDWANEPALFFRKLLLDPDNRFDNLVTRDLTTQAILQVSAGGSSGFFPTLFSLNLISPILTSVPFHSRRSSGVPNGSEADWLSAGIACRG